MRGQPVFSVGTDVGIVGEICGYGKLTRQEPGAMALTIKETDGAKPAGRPYKLADCGLCLQTMLAFGDRVWR